MKTIPLLFLLPPGRAGLERGKRLAKIYPKSRIVTMGTCLSGLRVDLVVMGNGTQYWKPDIYKKYLHKMIFPILSKNALSQIIGTQHP